MNTKIVLTTLSLATLVATPAFAQNQNQNQSNYQYQNQYQNHRLHHARMSGAYASVPQPTSVLSEGRIIGTDPDPSIRFELNRDAPTYLGDN